MIKQTVQVMSFACVAVCLLASCVRSSSNGDGDAHQIEQADIASPVMYLRKWSGLREGEERVCPFEFVLFESGVVIQCVSSTGGFTPQLARLTQHELNEVLAAVSDLKLAGLSEQSRHPPSGRHLEIGIRSGGGIRRYSWSGFDGDLAASEVQAFKKAWGEAKLLIDRVGGRTWNPAPPDVLDRVEARLR